MKTSIQFLIVFCFSGLVTTTQAQVSSTERQNLIDLYNATDGGNWTNHSNWDTDPNSTSDVSTWHGVSTEVIGGTEYVIGLNLSNNNLTGTPPTSFSSFTHLKRIQFQDNALSGILFLNATPNSNYDTLFVNNTQLERIEFDGDANYTAQMRFHNNPNLQSIVIQNAIHSFKNIPLDQIDIHTQFLSTFHTDSLINNQDIDAMEDLVDMSNLTYYRDLYTHLNSYEKGFKTTQFTGEKRVTEVYFQSSGIQGNLPLSLQNFSEVSHLELNYNQISHVSDTIWSALDNLEHLNISYNSTYTHLEDSLYTLPQLTHLNFRNCNSDVLEIELGLLTQLEYLNFASNDIELIPTSIENLTNLKTLIAAPNPIASIPSEVGDLILLEELNFADCDLTNTPTELGNLSNLKRLYLHNNQIQIIFPGIGNLTQLEELTLYDNLITSLPPDFGNLIRLKTLNLNKNHLSTLPESIGRLDSLTTLIASFNQLTTLPDSIGFLESLEILNLDGSSLYSYNNNITNLPHTIGNLSQLKELNIRYNEIDSIPDEINNLTNLENLDFAYQSEYTNGVYTTFLEYIPSNLNGLTSLNRLAMNNSYYEGGIDISNLNQLKYFYAQYNHINALKIPTPLTGSYTWNATSNPYITCIEVDGVDLNYWNQGIYYILKDNGVIYSDVCSGNNIPLAERLALIDLYHQCKHSTTNWTDWDTNTLSLSNVGSWLGVTTDTINGQKHVVDLSITAMIDTIPTSIQNLTQLKSCSFTGYNMNTETFNSLGDGFANLNALEEFYLYRFYGNQLPSNFGNLSSLKTLRIGQISYNPTNISSLPNSFGNLNNLKNLTIEITPLDSLPQSFGNLSQLETCNIHRTNITALPESVGRLDSLEQLYLSYNKLTSLPDSIGYMQNLEILDLDGAPYYSYDNNITNLPASIGNLSQLKELDLRYNHIDTIPDEINNLSNLEKLNLSYQSEHINGNYESFLEYAPSNFNGLTSLNRFEFNNSYYQGDIDISNLSQLQYFYGQYNRFTGLKIPVPTQYGYSWAVTNNAYLSCIEVDLASLDDWNNGVYSISRDNGVIYSDNCSGNSIPLAERLALIDLYHQCKYSASNWTNWDTNIFSLSNVGTWLGVTTDTINGQKHVVELNISYLVDTIPTSFQSLTHLKKCTLIGYQMNTNTFNSLGNGFSNLDSLKEFYLYRFAGNQLPLDFGNLSTLEKLRIGQISYNPTHISSLPHSIGDLGNLKNFHLELSPLDSLPSSFGNLSQLESCKIHRTNITTLPESMGRLDSLEELYLSYNKLTTLPDSIGYMQNLEILDLDGSPYYSYDNNITNLPASIGNLSQLKDLNLKYNALDTIPDEINNLSNLEKLNISYQSEYNNGVYTSFLEYVPSHFNGLTNLNRLELYNSYYQGDIDFSDLNNLQYFHGSNNRFTGLKIPVPTHYGYSWTATNNPYLSCIEVDASSLTDWNNGVHSISKDNGVIFSDNCSGNAVPQAERLALIDLYHQCKYANSTWTNWDTNTLSLSNVGSWQGVTTDTINGQKHVVALSLTSLVDTIPTSIQNLTQLKTCSFSGYNMNTNTFNGLGNGFSSLDSLEEFYLYRFAGEELPNDFGNLDNLETLRIGQISYNPTNISSLPNSFGDLEKLVNLTIEIAPLESLPETFGHLSKLKTCNIHRTLITTLPESIGQLDSLEHLSLAFNMITSLPDSFGYMQNLEVLNLNGSSYYSYNNNITSLPSSFANLSELKELQLQYNEIDGEVDLSSMELLEKLYLQYNYIDHLKLDVSPSSFGSTSLQYFNILNNQISCVEVPTDELISWRLYNHYNAYDDGVGFSDNCSNFSHEVPNAERLALIEFYKTGNGVNWNLSDYENAYDTNIYSTENVGVWYGVTVDFYSDSLEHVKHLEVSNKNYSGKIPTNIDSLAYLKSIKISHDTIKQIPPDLTLISGLDEINFGYSHIGDTVDLSGLNQLNKLNLSNSAINGLILTQHPDSFGIYDLQLQNNTYLNCIQVPTSYISLYEARNFYSVPSTIEFTDDCSGKFTIPLEEKLALIELYNTTDGDNWNNNSNWLQNNNVSTWHGITTAMVNGERHVTGISLYNNNLSGYVPDEISYLTHLKTIELSYNNLSGGISENISLLDSLNSLSMQNAQINGTINLSGNLALTQIYLSGNNTNVIKLGMPQSNLPTYYSLQAHNSPNLSCIEVPVSELTNYQNASYLISNTASFTTNCEGPILAFVSDTVYLDENGNASISAVDLDNGTTNADSTTTGLSFTLSDSVFDCGQIGSIPVLFTATSSNGVLTSDSTSILILDTIAPIITWNDTIFQLNGGDSIVFDSTTLYSAVMENCSLDSVWISDSMINCGDSTTDVTITAIDESGNQNQKTISVSTTTGSVSEITALNTTLYLDTTGQLTISHLDLDYTVTNTCSPIIPTISQTQFNCTNIGQNTLQLNIVDNSGHADSTTLILTIVDSLAPELSIHPSIDVFLDANGVGTIDFSALDNGTIDNCSYTFMSNTSNFTCSDLGTHSVQVWAVDSFGNSSEPSTVSVEVKDNMGPIIQLTDTTQWYLDETGHVSIDFNGLDNGTYDNCSIASTAISLTDFNCSHIGYTNIIVSVFDGEGNISNQFTTIEILDTIPPTPNLNPSLEVVLDASGQGVLTESMLVNAPHSGCNVTISYDSLFNCTDVGLHPLTVMAFNQSGDTTYTTAQVLVVDTIAPVLSVHSSMTGYLDANGQLDINIGSLDNGTSDQCTYTLTSNANSFDCSHLGDQTIQVWAVDESGNHSDSSSVTVQLLDIVNPVALLTDSTIWYLDSSGEVSLNFNALDNGSSDNCSIDSTHLSQEDFDCNSLGFHNITVSIFDGSGNSSSETITVEIVDTISPTLILNPSVQVVLNSSGEGVLTQGALISNFSDNCNSTISFDSVFTCADLGAQTVLVTATDGSGNTTQANTAITVVDTLDPALSVQSNINAYLDASGQVSIDINGLDNGTTDNCSYTLSASTNTFDCSTLGNQTIQVWAVDNSNNHSDSTTVTVQVLDTISPVASLNNSTIWYLDHSGQVNINYNGLNNASYDNCSIDSTHLSQDHFDCSSLGIQSVTVSLFDEAGNTTSETVTVEILDTISPTLVLNASAQVVLNNSGEGVLTYSSLIQTADDNCNITLSYDSIFTCSNLGPQTVTVTATDNSDNTTQINTTISVVDTVAPILSVQSTMNAYLDANGEASIDVNNLDNGTSDECSYLLAASSTSFDCTHLGNQSIQVWAQDNSGNHSDTTTVTIQVIDTINPNILLTDSTIWYLDGWGQVNIHFTGLDNGSFDNCSIDSTSISQEDFDCTSTGFHNITVSLFDEAGNISTESITVEIVDSLAPNLVLNSTVQTYLDSNGQAVLTLGDIDNGTTDNCGFTMTLSSDSFACSDLGTVQIDVTAIDSSGNTSTYTGLTVEVIDTISPEFTSIPDTVYLVCPNNLLDGITAEDNCGVDSIYIDPNSPTIQDGETGYFELNIIGTDGSNNRVEQTVVYHISGLNTTITYNNSELTVAESGMSYQWYTCPDTSFISGETNQNFTPTENGDYGVQITDGNCVYYSECFTVQGIGFTDYTPLKPLILYPNPTQATFTIANLNQTLPFEIVDLNGKQMLKDLIEPEQDIDISYLDKGTYLVKIDGYQITKLIKL